MRGWWKRGVRASLTAVMPAVRMPADNASMKNPIGHDPELRHAGALDDEMAESPDRREALGTLLKWGAAVGAGAVVAGAGRTLLESLRGRKTLPVLGLDGRVMTVDADALEVRAGSEPDHDARRGVPGRRWIMVIDLAKCDGCGKCMEGCAKMHFIPPGKQWIKMLLMPGDGRAAPYFFPQPCYQCDNPPCTKVCPVDATFKRDDGVVLVDNNRCIGCRFCMAACPYGARTFNWAPPADPPEAAERGYSPEWGYPRKVGTVEKCDFCPEMAATGKIPPCAQVCAMDAIYYGDENEDAVTCASGETLSLSKLLQDGGAYRHLEELGTKPRVYYLPPRNRMYKPPDPGEVLALSGGEGGHGGAPHAKCGEARP